MNPIIALIIANIIWGAGSPIFKLALTNIPPFLFGFSRFFFAALLILPFVLRDKSRLQAIDYRDLLIAGIFGVSLHIPMYFFGLQRTESINAPVIASAAPVFLFFLSVIFLKEKLNLKVFYGMIVSLIGVSVIVLAPLFRDKSTDLIISIEGNILLILSTVFFLISILIHKNLLNRIGPYKIAFWTFLFGSLPLIPFVVHEFNTWSLTSLNFYGAFGLIYGTFLNTVLAYALYYYGMSKIKAQEVGTFFYLDPVIAIIIAAPLLGEFPDSYFVIGTLLVFLGLYYSQGRIPWHPFDRIKKIKRD